MEKLNFASDYMEGAHPAIIEKLMLTNMEKTSGYGTDEYSVQAKEKIKQVCNIPDGDVFFLVGGTQANATVIDAVLANYQGVIACDSGHISIHEAGAIEHDGHKVLSLPHTLGKLSAAQIEAYCRTYYSDGNRDHMVMPGMVYISQPSEYGTLYSKDELTAIKEVCTNYNMKLYIDGARLAYALSAKENDVTLADMANIADIFYIGGTKCGCFFGEAVVLPHKDMIPHFFTIIKQHGALFAKGRILGIQFAALFTDHLYEHIGDSAIACADRMREIFTKHGYTLSFDSPTNQVFITIENNKKEALSQYVEFSFWEKADDSHTIIRLASSWATRMEDVEQLNAVLEEIA